MKARELADEYGRMAKSLYRLSESRELMNQAQWDAIRDLHDMLCDMEWEACR